MGKRDYRQSGHINSSWSGAVSLPVLRWYHAASSQSPPIAPTRHYIRIPSIGPCVREQSGRNSCSTRSSIVSKMLFLRDDLSSSRFRHFDSPFRAFEDRGARVENGYVPHVCANFDPFFFFLYYYYFVRFTIPSRMIYARKSLDRFCLFDFFVQNLFSPYLLIIYE